MKLSNMRVATRLGVGFGLVGLLLIAVLVLALANMRKLQSGMDQVTLVNDVEGQLSIAMEQSVTERALALRNLILLREAKEVEIEVRRIDDQVRKYAEAEQKLSSMFATSSTPDERATLDIIKQQAELAAPYIARASSLARDQKQDEAYTLLRFEFRPVQKKWWDAIRKLRQIEEAQNATALRVAAQSYERARNMMLAIGLIALLTSVAAAILITRSIVRQLGCEPGEAAEIAAEIAGGNLSCDIDTSESNSDSLLCAMKMMRDSLAQIVSEVYASTDTIATTAGQISAGNMDLSARTEQQASALEETASSMEELTSAVQQNADHARQANVLAVSASDVAVRGGAVVEQVVDTMAAIDTSARKIVDIISVIDSIAFQTNILALNAAVEAARAGEQGRGFAVVATEVRNLAQRSAAAAKEIKALIDDSVNTVQSGNRLVEQAGATMTEIVASVRRVTDIMSEIMEASQEQSMGIAQVNSTVSSMDAVTQQNAAMVEEAAAAAAAMQEQATRLSEAVGVFHLAGMAALEVPQSPVRVEKPALAKAAPQLAPPPVRSAPARKREQLEPAESEWEEF